MNVNVRAKGGGRGVEGGAQRPGRGRGSERRMEEPRDTEEKTDQWKKSGLVFQPPSFHLSRQMASWEVGVGGRGEGGHGSSGGSFAGGPAGLRASILAADVLTGIATPR